MIVTSSVLTPEGEVAWKDASPEDRRKIAQEFYRAIAEGLAPEGVTVHVREESGLRRGPG